MNELQVKETLQEMNLALEKSKNLVLQLSIELENARPKVEIYDHLCKIGHHENATDLMKKIKFIKDGKVYGRNTIYRFLREIKILRENNTPYIQYEKYFKVVNTMNAAGYVNQTPLFNIEGIKFLVKIIKQHKESHNVDVELRI